MIADLSALDSLGLASEADLTAEELIARGEKLLKLGRELQAQAAMLRGEKPQAPVSRPAGPSEDHSVGRDGLVTEESAAAKARELREFTRLQFEDALGLKGAATSKWIAKLFEHKLIERGISDAGAIVYRYARTLEDEPASYQVRIWVKQQTDPFDLETCVDQTELPTDEVEAALAELIADLTIVPVEIEAVNDLEEIEKLTGVFYAYQPPMPGGVQTDLERKRLAAMNGAASVEVQRGLPVRIRTERQQRRARSTPGNRQKTINQDRNWERLQAAKRKREEESRARAKRQREQGPKRRKASKPV